MQALFVILLFLPSFTQDWSRDVNWLCPPVPLIVRIVEHLVASKALERWLFQNGLLLIFAFVNPINSAVKRFVKECLILPRTCPVFDPVTWD